MAGVAAAGVVVAGVAVAGVVVAGVAVAGVVVAGVAAAGVVVAGVAVAGVAVAGVVVAGVDAAGVVVAGVAVAGVAVAGVAVAGVAVAGVAVAGVAVAGVAVAGVAVAGVAVAGVAVAISNHLLYEPYVPSHSLGTGPWLLFCIQNPLCLYLPDPCPWVAVICPWSRRLFAEMKPILAHLQFAIRLVPDSHFKLEPTALNVFVCGFIASDNVHFYFLSVNEFTHLSRDSDGVSPWCMASS